MIIVMVNRWNLSVRLDVDLTRQTTSCCPGYRAADAAAR
jgi:hypothetical protein